MSSNGSKDPVEGAGLIALHNANAAALVSCSAVLGPEGQVEEGREEAEVGRPEGRRQPQRMGRTKTWSSLQQMGWGLISVEGAAGRVLVDRPLLRTRLLDSRRKDQDLVAKSQWPMIVVVPHQPAI